MVSWQRVAISVMLIVAVGILASCGGDGTAAGDRSDPAEPSASTSDASPSAPDCAPLEAGKGTPVDVTERNGSFELATASVKAGSTTFTVTNTGPSTHEFVILATDRPPDRLPLTDGFGRPVDEKAPGITLIDKIENVSVGCPVSLTVDLDAGAYVLICNLPGHYVGGMHVPLKVT